MNTELLCTLGPASLNDGVIQRLEELGVSLFRLNLSHTPQSQIAPTLEYIQSQTRVPICLDTEGAQVRSGGLVDGRVKLRENSVIHMHRHRVPGDSYNINLNPAFVLGLLQVGDVLSMDDSILVQVVDIERDFVAARVLCGGDLGQNKAVTVQRDIPLPALTPKDRTALAIARFRGGGRPAAYRLHIRVFRQCRIQFGDALQALFLVAQFSCLFRLPDEDLEGVRVRRRQARARGSSCLGCRGPMHRRGRGVSR